MTTKRGRQQHCSQMNRQEEPESAQEEIFSSPVAKKRELNSPKTTRGSCTPISTAVGLRRSKRRRAPALSEDDCPPDVLVQEEEKGTRRKSGLLTTPRQGPSNQNLRETAISSKKLDTSPSISKRQRLVVEEVRKAVVLSSSENSISDEDERVRRSVKKWIIEDSHADPIHTPSINKRKRREEGKAGGQGEEEVRGGVSGSDRVTRSRASLSNAKMTPLRTVSEKITENGITNGGGGGGGGEADSSDSTDDIVSSSDTWEEEEEMLAEGKVVEDEEGCGVSTEVWNRREELFDMLPGRQRQVRILLELIGEVSS